MKKTILFTVLAVFTSVAAAEPILPNLEIVKKYLAEPEAAKAKANTCKAAHVNLTADTE